MEKMRKLLTRRDETGASAVEYGLLIAAIAAIIIATVFVLGKYVKSSFSTTCNNLKSEWPGVVVSGSCT